MLLLQRSFVRSAGVGNDRLISACVCVCGCTCVCETLSGSEGPHLHFDSVHRAGERSQSIPAHDIQRLI